MGCRTLILGFALLSVSISNAHHTATFGTRTVGTLTWSNRNPAKQSRYLQYTNKCTTPVWIQVQNNSDVLPGGGLSADLVKLDTNGVYQFGVDDAFGWGGRFQVKGECDNDGQNCHVGQSLPPCGNHGCIPAGSLYHEFFLPPLRNTNAQYFDLSAVDGYDIFPVTVTPTLADPSNPAYSCGPIAFGFSAADYCPTETDFYQIPGQPPIPVSLAATHGGHCFAPCKVATAPTDNYWVAGIGQVLAPIAGDPALQYCCPTTVVDGVPVDDGLTSISPSSCRQGKIIHTQYYAHMKSHPVYKYTYAFAYDDELGTFTCPVNNSFNIIICPTEEDLAAVPVPPHGQNGATS